MVARALILTLLFWQICSHALAGSGRQQCLGCHPAHFIERGGCITCHRGNPLSDRKNIAHGGLVAGKYASFTISDGIQVKEGQRLMERLACRRCHVSVGRGNRLAANLDEAAVRKSADGLADSIRRPVINMPDFRLNDGEITDLVTAVLAGSLAGKAGKGAPVAVHFNSGGKSGKDLFSTRCGACHRIISERLGALGTGDAGPNLSGLFSPYYPKTFKSGEPWTVRSLTAWLKNPRAVKPGSTMMPVMLTDPETRELGSIMQVTSEQKR